MNKKSTDIASKKTQASLSEKKKEKADPFDILGTGNTFFGEHLVKRDFNCAEVCVSDSGEKDKSSGFAAHAALMVTAPRDEIEGMLVTQMLATHNAAMKRYKRVMHAEEQTYQGLDIELKHAEKLSKLYLEQMAALERYRGKRNRPQVGQVNVGSGGQAIVGDVHQNVERSSKKQDGK